MTSFKNNYTMSMKNEDPIPVDQISWIPLSNTSHTTEPNQPILIIDLGEARTIMGIQLEPEDPYSQRGVTSFEAYSSDGKRDAMSDDELTWTILEDIENVYDAPKEGVTNERLSLLYCYYH